MECVVDGCHNYKTFKFPNNQILREKWLEAINKPSLKPKRWNVLCAEHFKPEDILENEVINLNGSSHEYQFEKKHLRKGAIPCIFPWNTEQLRSAVSSSVVSNSTHSKIRKVDSTHGGHCTTLQFTQSIIDPNLDVYEESVSTSCDVQQPTSDVTSQIAHSSEHTSDPEQNGKGQCLSVNKIEGVKRKSVKKPRYDIDELKDDPRIILEFTGIENHYKFVTVFYSLGERKNRLKIKGNGAYGGLSKENQLFLTLWKLRKNCTDTELASHFNISRIAVGNIFKTWIQFMSKQWSKIDIWPSRALVDFYMPEGFKEDFPKTRVIIVATEFHVERSKNPVVQQSSFSVYKNDTTMKGVVGCTAGGLISYASDLYGGSTSDRQITERSDLMRKCQTGDLVMADRGFNVQDIFAPAGVTVAIPHFKKGKGYLPFKDLMTDRKLSKYRVHVERVIGLLKTYKILSTKLGCDYVQIAGEIFKVCIMLCNFKENIMCSRA